MKQSVHVHFHPALASGINHENSSMTMEVKSMGITIEGMDNEKDCRYAEQFVIREPGGIDYGSAVVLLRNLGERKDTTSLEREALSTAIRLLQHNTNAKQ